MWKSVRKVETVVDETGSAQLLWSLLDLRKKEGEVVLEPIVSYHDYREKQNMPVKTISKEVCPCSLYLGSEEHQPVQQPLLL